MLSLPEVQANFIRTINDGPDALLPGLFADQLDRVMLGLKAHANTISHARLVALEESFLRTRAAMGEAEFSAISRSFCETAIARSAPTNQIGTDFASFLSVSDFWPGLVDLARIEWAWLQSYHAAEAPAMTLADLSAAGAVQMLNIRVDVHPAAQLVKLQLGEFRLIEELGVVNAGGILVTRPDAEVKLSAVEPIVLRLFEEALQGCKVCNLIELAVEECDEQEALAPIITLISAGALVQRG